MGQGFENGILKYTKLEKNKAKGATNGQMQTNGVQCYNRYLITYYTDGTQTEEFLYTWCEGLDDCQTTGTVHLSDGQQEIKTFCAGGGGGVPPVVNECGMTEEEVTTILEGMTCTNANSLVYEGGSQNIDPATGFLSEAWNAKWNFQDVALPAVGTIKLDAWYVGKRYQESINSNWKWEMIEFNKVIPKRNIPCLEIIVDPVCSVSINQNKQYATSTIDGRCKAQITCFMTLQIGKPFDFHNYTNSIDAN